LEVLDITDPSSPQQVRILTTWAAGFTINGNYLYLACGDTNVKIFNVENISNPHEVGYYVEPVSAICVAANDGIAFVGGYSGFRTFDCSDALGVVDRESESTPTQFDLKPNYPNPFNSSTTIRYSIAKSSKVDLKLFDVTGREVATLVDFHQSPGEYTLRLDGSKLAAGTYFVRLKAGDFFQSRKLLLMK
jgi:hypothetical protein